MRMPAHIHQVALKQIARVIRMQRLDLRMLGGVQVVSIVALDGLMEERQAQRQHHRNDQRNPRYHWTGTPGLSVHTWVPGMSRSSSANCSGRPVSGGNVPKCSGITLRAPSIRHASAASRGLMVYTSPIGKKASSG